MIAYGVAVATGVVLGVAALVVVGLVVSELSDRSIVGAFGD